MASLMLLVAGVAAVTVTVALPTERAAPSEMATVTVKVPDVA
jgi:hypothetical protein